MTATAGVGAGGDRHLLHAGQQPGRADDQPVVTGQHLPYPGRLEVVGAVRGGLRVVRVGRGSRRAAGARSRDLGAVGRARVEVHVGLGDSELPPLDDVVCTVPNSVPKAITFALLSEHPSEAGEALRGGGEAAVQLAVQRARGQPQRRIGRHLRLVPGDGERVRVAARPDVVGTGAGVRPGQIAVAGHAGVDRPGTDSARLGSAAAADVRRDRQRGVVKDSPVPGPIATALPAGSTTLNCAAGGR